VLKTLHGTGIELHWVVCTWQRGRHTQLALFGADRSFAIEVFSGTAESRCALNNRQEVVISSDLSLFSSSSVEVSSAHMSLFPFVVLEQKFDPQERMFDFSSVTACDSESSWD
jgi:hypothetical protein